jgi:hypothetical protein
MHTTACCCEYPRAGPCAQPGLSQRAAARRINHRRRRPATPPLISSACDVRAALWARCEGLSLAKLALSRLASRSPYAPEPALLFKSSAWPDSPGTVISSQCDALLGRCEVLSLAKLASRASDAPEQVLLAMSAAGPDWARLAENFYLLGMRRARGPVGPLRRPAARQAGALHAGVSGRGCSGAGPARHVSSRARLDTTRQVLRSPRHATCARPCGPAATPCRSTCWRSPD